LCFSVICAIVCSIPAFAAAETKCVGVLHHGNGWVRLKRPSDCDAFRHSGAGSSPRDGCEKVSVDRSSILCRSTWTRTVIRTSLAFAGAEVSLWVIYASYIHWADNRTARFEQYADANWDVTRYVDWIIQWQSQLNAGSTWSRDQIIVNPNAANPWDRIDWTRLNQCEEEIAQAVGNGFTHRLPPRPQQQYYELIGKYPQYGGGWNDASGFTPGNILTDNVSPNFLIYRDMRGGANEMYNIARTASLVIVANHVLSALEAAWEVSRANRTVEARAELRPVMRGGGFVEFVPHVDVKLRL